jgi:anti-sigma factor RsiW
MSEHASPERIEDYLAGFLDEQEAEALEAHLFSCGDCAIESEKLFGLAAAIREAVPPVLTAERFAQLERAGRIAAVNPMSPGGLAEVRYPPEQQLLVHRLGGSDLREARRVDVALLDLDGRAISRFDDVPFDPARGEVLVACQSHFAELFPHDAVFRLEVVRGDRREESSRYTVLHRP